MLHFPGPPTNGGALPTCACRPCRKSVSHEQSIDTVSGMRRIVRKECKEKLQIVSESMSYCTKGTEKEMHLPIRPEPSSRLHQPFITNSTCTSCPLLPDPRQRRFLAPHPRRSSPHRRSPHKSPPPSDLVEQRRSPLTSHLLYRKRQVECFPTTRSFIGPVKVVPVLKVFSLHRSMCAYSVSTIWISTNFHLRKQIGTHIATT